MRFRLSFAAASLAAWLSIMVACGGGQAPPAAGSAPAPAAGPAAAPADAQAAPAADAPSDAAIAAALKPWTGDLDGMVERRFIRVLVTFNKTNYFVDKAEQHGATYEAGKLFETFLNNRLKTRHIKVNLVFVAVSRDRLFPALAEGRGDIAAAGLTITAEREKQADFAAPFITGVRQLVVTAPGEPAVATPEALSGRQVYVRKSSAAHEHLLALNASLARRRQAAGEHRRGQRGARGRGHPGDGEHRHDAGHGGGPAHRGVLAPDLHEHAGAAGGAALRRADRLGPAPGHARAAQGGRRLRGREPAGLAHLQHHPAPVFQEHVVREERRGGGRAEEVPGGGRASSGSTATSTTCRGCWSPRRPTRSPRSTRARRATSARSA